MQLLRKEQILRAMNEARLIDQLDQAIERLEEGEERLAKAYERKIHEIRQAKADTTVKPLVAKGMGRAWFSGLGKICAGTGLTFANLWLASASLPLKPASGSTVIASATLGFGTILEGLGKLRGEN
jgi:hypothetical protein